MYRNVRRFSKLNSTEHTLDDYFKVVTVTLRRKSTAQDSVSDDPTFNESFRIELVGWRNMFGIGNTIDEAYSNLKHSFNEYLKEHKSPPEPSDYIVTTVYEDSEEYWKEVAALRYDFLPRILGYQAENCWITQYSSIWDFIDWEDKDTIFLRIQCEYEIDVSDIEDGNLLHVFERIVKQSSIWQTKYKIEYIDSIAQQFM